MNRCLRLLFFLALALWGTAGMQAAILRVKPNVASTAWQGQSNVYSDLQSALTAAVSGDEIWVAVGTYKPTIGTDRTISFNLKDGAAIYGGFAGTETLRTQRNWVNNPTILSGDIGQTNEITDNSYHVITINSNLDNAIVIIDGLTIIDGNGEQSYKGGGVFSTGGNIRIVNCLFKNNSANNGGAISYESGYLYLGNTIFYNNYAYASGGSVYSLNWKVYAYNCQFSKNRGDRPIFYAQGVIYNSIIWDNEKKDVFLSKYYESYNLSFYNCIIEEGPTGNSCSTMDPLLASDSFQPQSGSPAIDNGYTVLPSWLKTDYNNKPRIAGNAVDIGVYEIPVTNLFQLESPKDGAKVEPTEIELKWSYIDNKATIKGYQIESTIDNSKISVIDVGKSDNYKLQIEANAHVYKWRVRAKYSDSESAWSDQRTFYVNKRHVLYVKPSSTGDGSSWAKAFGSIDDAIEASFVGSEIWVMKGTYQSRNTSFLIKQGVDLYGGFEGDETLLNQRDWKNNPTILKGSSIESVIIAQGSANNQNRTVFDGFTVTNGYSDNTSVYRGGGGFLLLDFPITIKNCLITKNAAYLIGGGICAVNSNLEIYNTIVSNNNSASQGAGIWHDGDTLKIFNSLIYKNKATASDYAGIKSNGKCYVYNTIVSGNLDYNNKVSNIGGSVVSYSSFIGGSEALILDDGLSIDPLSPCVNKGDFSYVVASQMPVDYNGDQRIKGNNVDIGPFEVGTATPIPSFPVSKTYINNQVQSDVTLRWFPGVNSQGTYDLAYWSTGKDTVILKNISDTTYTLSLPLGETNWRVRYAGKTLPTDWSPTFSLYVYGSPKVIYVDVTKSGDGASWGQATPSLQKALAMASLGDEIWVAKGTYYPSSTNKASEFFELRDGISMYGGFKGGETSRSERNPFANPTILSGEIGSISSITDNTSTILKINGSNSFNQVLSGFIIERCYDSRNDYNWGAINVSNARATIDNCLIQNNTSIDYTAGIYGYGSSLIIRNCIFYKNKSSDYGTAIYIVSKDVDSPVITNCNFIENTNYNDPVVYVLSDNETVLRNCIFKGNSMYKNREVSGATTLNCCLQAFSDSPTSFVADPLFVNESSGNFLLSLNSPCVNKGSDFIQAGDLDFSQNKRVVGGIVDIGAFESTVPAIKAVQPMNGEVLEMSNNIIPSLKWVDSDYKPTNKYRTQYWIKGSDIITSVDNNVDQTTPLLEVKTNQEYEWRVGVYSSGLASYVWSDTSTFYTGRGYPFYVKKGGNGSGSSWNDAMGDISEALNKVGNGDQIWVAEGVYNPSSSDRNSSFFINKNITLLGGFKGTETRAIERNPYLNKTVLSGNIGSLTDSTDNTKQILVISLNNVEAKPIINGFTISGAYNTDLDAGAILISNSSPLISHCTIKNNHSKKGAGITISSGSPVISNTLIVQNSSSEIGCAVVGDEASMPKLINCTIAQNRSNGASAVYGNASLYNCISYMNYNLQGYWSIDKATGFNSCFENRVEGKNCTYASPNFEDFATYKISAFSPCLNTGDKKYSLALSTDIASNSRVYGQEVDMGAYEVQTVPKLKIISISPANNSNNISVRPVIELEFNAEVKGADISGVKIANLYGKPIFLNSNDNKKLLIKMPTLEFDREYEITIKGDSYVYPYNVTVVGSDTTITFRTKTCTPGSVTLTLLNDGKCNNELLTIHSAESGDIYELPDWYINDELQNYQSRDFVMSQIQADLTILYVNIDECGNELKAELDLSNYLKPIEIIHKWDDILLISNVNKNLTEFSWTTSNSTKTGQYFELDKNYSGTIIASALDTITGCRLFAPNMVVNSGTTLAVSVSPNPVLKSGSVEISLPEATSSTSVKLFDAQGRLLVEEMFSDTSRYTFNQTNFVPGVYIMEIATADEKTIVKLVIQ